MATRFNKVGFAGGKGTAGQTDPYTQTLVIPIEAVASATDQRTGVFTPPAGCQVTSCFINVITAEVSALVKTVDIGHTVGGGVVVTPNALLDDAEVSQRGISGNFVNSGAFIPTNEEFTYTLAGADFVQFKGELVIVLQGSDLPAA